MRVRYVISVISSLPWHFFVAALTLLLLPFTPSLALTQDGSTVMHLLYPAAHAGLLHWCVNMMAWLPLYRIITRTRLACAYACAVLMGYLLPISLPVCGWSAIIFFFIGLMLPVSSRSRILLILSLTAVSMLLPGIAAWFHLTAMASGIVYHLLYRISLKIRRHGYQQ